MSSRSIWPSVIYLRFTPPSQSISPTAAGCSQRRVTKWRWRWQFQTCQPPSVSDTYGAKVGQRQRERESERCSDCVSWREAALSHRSGSLWKSHTRFKQTETQTLTWLREQNRRNMTHWPPDQDVLVHHQLIRRRTARILMVCHSQKLCIFIIHLNS